jgi:putative transcription antitermination factor YqgF
MKILGIDYGKVYLGLAVAYDDLIRPLCVIKSKSDHHKISSIVRICRDESVNRIVIGTTTGKQENIIKGFIGKLRKSSSLEIIEVDETLTSVEAMQQMINEGISKQDRKVKIHSYSAVCLLKLFLDSR